MLSKNDALTELEKDIIVAGLNGDQRKYIHTLLKEAKQRAFAKITETKLDRWELINLLDAGPFWIRRPRLFCECGDPIRYQYIIRNDITGEVKRLGLTHVQEHTGITPQQAQGLEKAIEEIYEERDELLLKYSLGWSLQDAGIRYIPYGVEIPEFIQEQLDLDLPLFDIQIAVLRIRIYDYYRDRVRESKAGGRQVGSTVNL